MPTRRKTPVWRSLVRGAAYQLIRADLFAALKGGGSSFGIVTAYTLETHPLDHKVCSTLNCLISMLTDQVWGGNYIFTHQQTPQVLEALRNFVDTYPDDKAAIICTYEHAAFISTWIMFLFYDGPSPPEGVFDNFTAIGPTPDTTKTFDTYYDLVCYLPSARVLD
jgi:hypothetical protein